jgi:hypothetical protein
MNPIDEVSQVNSDLGILLAMLRKTTDKTFVHYEETLLYVLY